MRKTADSRTSYDNLKNNWAVKNIHPKNDCNLTEVNQSLKSKPTGVCGKNIITVQEMNKIWIQKQRFKVIISEVFSKTNIWLSFPQWAAEGNDSKFNGTK